MIKEFHLMTILAELIRRTVLLGLCMFCATSAAFGQSAIFNVPSTDTEPKRSIYLEADFYAHFASLPNNGFQIFGTTVVYGVSNKVEAGVNYFYTREEGLRSSELQPNLKWKMFESDKCNCAVSAGAIGFIPLNEAAGSDPIAQVYVNVSKTFKSANELVLTAGFYQMVGAHADFGTRTGAFVGVVQPLSKKVDLLVDWSSGKNRFGYGSAGLGFKVSDSQYFGTGYSIGNSERGNNYFTAFYGFTF